MNKINSPAIHAFRQSPPLTAAVGVALQDPALQRAISLIRNTTLPTGLPAPMKDVPYDTTVSHLYHFTMGVNAALTALEAMATPAPERKPPDPAEEEFAGYADQDTPTITR